MKMVIQSTRQKRPSILDIPVGSVLPGTVLVQTAASFVSAGTERAIVEFSGKSLVDKAKTRPDLVRQVLDKARTDGIVSTLNTVRNKMDQSIPLGYSSAGTVIAVGEGIKDVKIGDRVACGGAGASHSEIGCVPRNLFVPIPESVDFESASFTTIGAIAMQGVRLADTKLGETVAIIGLGLIGLITVQILKAAGATVVGMDPDAGRAELARKLGADGVATNNEEFLAIIHRFSSNRGADQVLITAATTSDGPVTLAGAVARDRGRVVAVGAVGFNIPRNPYYYKELDFQVSRSYGPGRYDPEYEAKGHDYPVGYVRWTENRNMAAFIALVSEGKVNVKTLITHRFPVDRAAEAYDLITGEKKEPYLGVVLLYPDTADMKTTVLLDKKITSVPEEGGVRPLSPLQCVRLGVVGAGNFANAGLLPLIKDIKNLVLVGIAGRTGIGCSTVGRRFGFGYCTTETQKLLDDASINTIALLTRHHLHAGQVVAALKAGKNVFVEKPLCLTGKELEDISSVYQAIPGRKPALMVGFNRRFAPYIRELKEQLQKITEPLMLNYRVNAGFIPLDHWTQDPAQGGGRLLGEGCHFIDTILFLADNAPLRVECIALPDSGRYAKDNFLVTIQFANGSIGTVTYVANGDKSFGKEYLEIFGGGLSARLDDYRTLRIHQGKTRIFRKSRLGQDKGHKAEWEALVGYLCGKKANPMSFKEIVHSTKAALAAKLSLDQQSPVLLEEDAG